MQDVKHKLDEAREVVVRRVSRVILFGILGFTLGGRS